MGLACGLQQAAARLHTTAPLVEPSGDQVTEDKIPPADHGPSRIWLPELVQHYAERLPPNESAVTLRLVNKATSAHFRAPQHTTVRLSLPVPHHAFVWRWGREEALSGLTWSQREKLPRLTARSGSIANLEVLLAREDAYSRPQSTQALIEAAGAGQLEACRWLRQQGCPWDEWVLRKAAGGGHRAVSEWLLAIGCPWSEGAIPEAARGGHVGLVDWLLGTGRSPNVAGLLAGAAEGCDLPTLQRLHHTYLDSVGTVLPSGNLAVMVSAASSPTADWRAKRGYPLTPSAALAVGTSGAVDVLQYVLDAGVELRGEAAVLAMLLHGAAGEGYLAVLQALHARGFLHVQLDGFTLAESAAQHGRLTVVAWLVETLGAAAVLSTRVFAAATGPRVSEFRECNRMELLAWLHEHGCPMGEDGTPYEHVLLNGDLAMLRYLRQLGCPWGPDGRVFTFAVQRGGDGIILSQAALPTLAWLLEQGCPVTWRKAEAAAARSWNPVILAWGAEDGTPSADHDPSRIWLPELVQRYAERLPPNESAVTLRLVNKATAAHFRAPQHTTVRLSLPVPHHAFVWRCGSEEALSGLTRGQREQLPRLTARSGSVANLEVLLAREDTYSRPLSIDTLVEAASAGQLEVCRWLRRQGCPWDEDVLRKAAVGGHRAVCEWLLASGCPWSEGAIPAAARGGHVGLVDWLLGTGRSPNVSGLLAGAAAGCDLPTLQRLHHTYLDRIGIALCLSLKLALVTAAAGSATADWRAKVEWLEGRGYPQSAGACNAAARLLDGRTRLEWLQQRGYPLTPRVAAAAATSGAVDALQYVLDAGVELPGEVAIFLTHAAEVGHLAVLQLLHARGLLRVQLGGFALAKAAARGGRLTVVAWLVETLGAAAVLSTRVFAAAAGSGVSECNRMELLAWVHEHGCPMGYDGTPYVWALGNGDLAMLRYLQQLGCPWGPGGRVFTFAVECCGDGTIPSQVARASLAWLLQQRCPVTWREAEAAAERNRNAVVLAWLHTTAPLVEPSGDQGTQDGTPSADHDPSRAWLPELVQRYAERLPPNESAVTLRLVNKATAAQFWELQHTTVRLSLPVPHHAFVWRCGSEEALSGLARGQREQLPRLTARSGSVANLEVLLAREDTYSRPLSIDALVEAAGAGQLEVCCWLRQQGCPWDEWVLRKAAYGGHRAVCEWLLASGCPWSEGAIPAAARGGHVGLVDWLLGTGRIPNVAGLLAGAAEGCDLPTLQHLHHTYLDSVGIALPPPLNIVVAASAAGSPTADWRAKVEWLEGQGYPRGESACKEAARLLDGRGRLEWLRQRGYPLTPWATFTGAVDVLQYVLDAGVELGEQDAVLAVLLTRAAEVGHLAVLQLLHARGLLHVQLDGFALAKAAARGGRLTVVAWLVETLGAAAVLSAEVFAAAASSGVSEFSEFGRMELLAWLHEHGCPMGEDGTPYMWALSNGDLAMLRYLRQLGCPWGPDGRVFTFAVQCCGDGTILSQAARPTLAWLLQQGCPVASREAEAAAERS
ncbi:Ankyrin repeat domain-containing protein [Tetrabaena socialis]|uniref:Ankyrin repeat domain-containing protein n=1 Tax=Tetrabaena socialis TaxID=47790 RepID=A0A2J7ZYH3_9CHLO|nr:Ankyrin repeat domain-containing protein [Tetrabaena socialis]|eukprot:PNH05310.1 Ankyrin repeat domain-containing protein [Tetrabaena socialis]